MTTRAELYPWIGKPIKDREADDCPRCGYGPLGAYHRKVRRKKCPACFLRLPWPDPEPVR